MKELFVPYELAVLAKEKGFDKYCLAAYGKRRSNSEIVALENHFIDTNQNVQQYDLPNNKGWENAPLYQQLVDWFDEKHNIRIDFTHSQSTGKYKFAIWQLINGKWEKQFNATSEFTKEERNIKALTEAFKLI